MATIDRLDPAYTPWTLSGSDITTAPDTTADTYRGRHRHPQQRRRLSLTAFLHTPQHRADVPAR